MTTQMKNKYFGPFNEGTFQPQEQWLGKFAFVAIYYHSYQNSGLFVLDLLFK